MKHHMKLLELAQELQRQSDAKQDYLVDTRQLSVRYSDPEKAVLEIPQLGEEFELAETAHQQMAQRLAIPKRYYERLRKEHPDLLENQVNALMKREPERRMVRTLDGQARAILSDRFRRLDHDRLVETVLPLVAEQQIDMQASSFSLSAERLYMKLVLPRTEAEVRKGDIVQSGIIISNSEVGLGTLQITPMLYRLVCTNGMVAPESVAKVQKTHRGARHAVLGELLSEETLDTQDRAFWMEVGDLTHATLDKKHFLMLVDRMRQATEHDLEGDPAHAIDILRKQHALSESEGEGILVHLLRGGDLTQYGLLNAVTRFAQDVDDYHRSTELETLGGQILEMSNSSWRRIATAA